MSLKLREWRRVKEISQQAMADQLKVHLSTYQKMEKNPGKISLEDAVKIAGILGVPLDDISFIEQEPAEVNA